MLSSMATATAQDCIRPIVIYRSVNRDGQTFGLEPDSFRRIRDQFGADVHVRPRVFIAHETISNYEDLRADLAAQVIQLLTGVAEERLGAVGGVIFRDPATDEDLPRS